LIEQQSVEAFAHDHVREWFARIAYEVRAIGVTDLQETDRVLNDGIDREGQQLLGSEWDTATARLVAWELGSIDHQHTRTRSAQFARRGAPGGACPDHDDIESRHT